jgi:membrane protease YdiL (CAAX protease family)
MNDALSLSASLAASTPATDPLARRVWRHYREAARRHPLVLGLVLACFAAPVVLGDPPEGHSRWVTAAYPLTMAFCAVLFDALLLWRKAAAPKVAVKRPGNETLWVLGTFGIGVLWLAWKFAFPHGPPVLGVLTRPPFLLGAMLFLAPVLPTVVLLRRGYRAEGFALTRRAVWIAPVLIALFAGVTRAVAPEVFAQGLEMVRGMGIPRALALGFGMAAVPEEVFRHLSQSRLGALLGNRAVGWLLTAYLWSAGHIPAHFEGAFHSLPAFGHALLGAVGLMPLGLLWGYLTLRSGSLLPSVLLHGTNIWGLQNL